MATWSWRIERDEGESAWENMMAFGSRIREPEYWEDALAAARESMLRVRHNVEALIERLDTAGYAFAMPGAGAAMSTEFGAYAVYLPPGPDIVAYLEEVERRVGLLPLSLRAWYEVVGSVNLMGSHPDFGDPDYDLLDPWWCCLSRR